MEDVGEEGGPDGIPIPSLPQLALPTLTFRQRGHLQREQSGLWIRIRIQ
jgi:hypothetical protein